MKNLILDEPIRESFSDFLEKGETILWSGNPRLHLSFFDHVVKNPLEQIPILLLITLFLTVIVLPFFGPLGGIISFLILIIIQHFWIGYKNRSKKNTNYAISQKRIFFSFKNMNDTTIHTIDFEDLDNFQINQDNYNSKANTFFLAVENPKKIDFTTYNFKNGERRHQPTLELIEDAKTISNLLKEGIKNANASL